MPHSTISLGKKGSVLRPAATAKGVEHSWDGLSAVEKLGTKKLPLGTGRKAGSAVNG